MARNCRALVRQFLVSGSNPCAALVHHYHKLSCNSIHTLLLGLTSIPTISSSPTTIASTSKPFSNFFCAPNLHLLQHRRLVSSPPGKYPSLALPYFCFCVIDVATDFTVSTFSFSFGTLYFEFCVFRSPTR